MFHSPSVQHLWYMVFYQWLIVTRWSPSVLKVRNEAFTSSVGSSKGAKKGEAPSWFTVVPSSVSMKVDCHQWLLVFRTRRAVVITDVAYSHLYGNTSATLSPPPSLLLAQVAIGQSTVVSALAVFTSSDNPSLHSVTTCSGDWLDHATPLITVSHLTVTSVFLRDCTYSHLCGNPSTTIVAIAFIVTYTIQVGVGKSIVVLETFFLIFIIIPT